jgi:hypothetical protein
MDLADAYRNRSFLTQALQLRLSITVTPKKKSTDSARVLPAAHAVVDDGAGNGHVERS